ncbi:MAG TPA: hypothetical protein VHN79_10565 [Lacunisphaera sp.]|nr:hypothetical protein [Lacunisphaera sp.]
MITYRINREARLVAVRFAGALTLPDFQAVFQKVLAECPEAVAFDTINDARPEHTFFSSEEVRSLARIVKRTGLQDSERRSVVLTDNKGHFGISRIFEILTEPESKVKRLTTESLAEAAAWLKRPESLLQSELALLAEAGVERV